MQVQNFAFARKEIVFDVEPVHGLEMSPQHRNRNHFRDGGGFRRAVFNGMQRLQTHLQILFVGLVPLRDSSVQIPAVIIET